MTERGGGGVRKGVVGKYIVQQFGTIFTEKNKQSAYSTVLYMFVYTLNNVQYVY